MFLKYLITFIFFILSNNSFAIKNFDNSRVRKITNMVKCLNHKQNLNLHTTIDYKLKDFDQTLNMALTLNALDNDIPLKSHCHADSITSLSKTLEKLGLFEYFRSISKKINYIYPRINLIELRKKSFFCRSNKRLERIVGPGVISSAKRIMAWKQGQKDLSQGIFYEKYPSVKATDDKYKLTWVFVKELLHNYVNLDRDFYDRDADLQQIIQLFQKQFQNDSLNVDSIKTEALKFEFPYYK